MASHRKNNSFPGPAIITFKFIRYNRFYIDSSDFIRIYTHIGSLSIKSEIPAGLEISLQMARIITPNKQTSSLMRLVKSVKEKSAAERERPREIFQTFLSFAVFDLGRVPPLSADPLPLVYIAI